MREPSLAPRPRECGPVPTALTHEQRIRQARLTNAAAPRSRAAQTCTETTSCASSSAISPTVSPSSSSSAACSDETHQWLSTAIERLRTPTNVRAPEGAFCGCVMRFRPCLGCLDLCEFEDVPLHRLALLAPANNSGGRAGSDAATQTWSLPAGPRPFHRARALLHSGLDGPRCGAEWSCGPMGPSAALLRALGLAPPLLGLFRLPLGLAGQRRRYKLRNLGRSPFDLDDGTNPRTANECTHAHAREPRLVAINASPSLPLAGSAAVRERARRRRALTCACVCGGNVHVGDGADGPHLHGDRGGGRGGGGRGRRPSTAQTLFAADGEKGFA